MSHPPRDGGRSHRVDVLEGRVLLTVYLDDDSGELVMCVLDYDPKRAAELAREIAQATVCVLSPASSAKK